MSNAKRDSNNVPTLIGVSSIDGTTPTLAAVNPVTGRILVDLPGGTGVVTSVSYLNSDTASTLYNDVANTDTDINNIGNVMCGSHTVKNLFVKPFSNSLNSGSLTLTIMKNGVATNITCAAVHGATTVVSDIANSTPVVGGDIISVRSVTTAGSGKSLWGFSYEID